MSATATAATGTEAIVISLQKGQSVNIPKGSLYQVAFVENASKETGHLGLQQGASHLVITIPAGKTFKINLNGNGATLTNDGPPALIVKY